MGLEHSPDGRKVLPPSGKDKDLVGVAREIKSRQMKLGLGAVRLGRAKTIHNSLPRNERAKSRE